MNDVRCPERAASLAQSGEHAQSPILIAGPTASGKSSLALAKAVRDGGVVINADSMQVYRELRVLTARPAQDAELCAPHMLYGHVPAAEAYSAGRFVDDARRAIAQAHSQNQRVILVGGTGLYFKALLEGLSPIPSVGEDVRAHWRREGERLGAKALRDILQARDPVTASRLGANDTQRLVRALEVLDASGQPLSFWQAQPGEPVIQEADCERILVVRDRDQLYERADARFARMMEEGAVEEVRCLMELNLSSDLPAMRALGVRPLIQYLKGMLSRDEAVAQAQAETRQFIKRQETWARRYMISWTRASAQ